MIAEPRYLGGIAVQLSYCSALPAPDIDRIAVDHYRRLLSSNKTVGRSSYVCRRFKREADYNKQVRVYEGQ